MPTNKKTKGVLLEGIGQKKDKLTVAAEAKGLAMEPLKNPRGKKRGSTSLLDENTEPMDEDMESMIASFGADISKTLGAKRKRLESFTDSSIKASNKKVEEVWSTQRAERQRLGDEYKKQTCSVLSHWEDQLAKTKAEEEKLQALLEQQQKLFQQQRAAQTQSLKTIKKLHQQYMKGMEELEGCHKQQQGDMTEEVKQEMAQFQKKVLMESQYQDLSNVKRSLQNMLAQV